MDLNTTDRTSNRTFDYQQQPPPPTTTTTTKMETPTIFYAIDESKPITTMETSIFNAIDETKAITTYNEAVDDGHHSSSQGTSYSDIIDKYKASMIASSKNAPSATGSSLLDAIGNVSVCEEGNEEEEEDDETEEDESKIPTATNGPNDTFPRMADDASASSSSSSVSTSSDDESQPPPPEVSLESLHIQNVSLPPEPDFTDLNQKKWTVSLNWTSDNGKLGSQRDVHTGVKPENDVEVGTPMTPPDEPDVLPSGKEEEEGDLIGRRRMLRRLYACGWITVVVLLAVMVGFLVANKRRVEPRGGTGVPTGVPTRPPVVDRSGTGVPTASPTVSPTPVPTVPATPPAPTASPTAEEQRLRTEAIVSVLTNVTDESVLSEPGTPQNEALQWILSEDSVQAEEEVALRQRYVLATLYFATSGDGWDTCGRVSEEDGCVNRFLGEGDECRWFGVQCNLLRREVTGIDLAQNGLRGALPPEIASLLQLTSINLSRNKLSGSLHPTLSTLTKLRTLLLNNNDLFGSIPSGLDSLSRLRTLSVGNNQLTGPIPTDFVFQNLRNLDLEGNQFQGTLPPQFFQNQQLRQVDLASNRFSGTISPSWSSLQNLNLINLESNQWEGTLPDQLFTPSLLQISVKLNNLVGTIPNTLFSASDLQYLDIGSNQFNGTLSTRFGELTQLTHVILNGNRLTGTIPVEIGNLTQLESFSAVFNYLDGSVPEGVCDLMTVGKLNVLGMDCSPRKNAGPRVVCTCCNLCLSGYDDR